MHHAWSALHESSLYAIPVSNCTDRLVLFRSDLLEEVCHRLARWASEAQGSEEGHRILPGSVVHDLRIEVTR